MITVPHVSLSINLLFMCIVCPLQYFFLMSGSSSVEKILAMKYSESFYSNFNNFKIREMFDNVAKKELDKDEFPNFSYRLLKSKLYMIYALLYFLFVTFFANLLPLSTFIDKYGKLGSGKRSSKCFIHTDTRAIVKLGTLILIIIPSIVTFLNFFGFQFGLFIHLASLTGGGAALLTSVYYKNRQNLKQALQFRDTVDPPPHGVPLSGYKGSDGELINSMPSFFWALYIAPAICIVVVLFMSYICNCKHSIIWGIICSFGCVAPLYYLMSKQLSLYCIQFPFCVSSPETLKETIHASDYKVDTAEDINFQLKTLRY
jgi:hypothetical protein